MQANTSQSEVRLTAVAICVTIVATVFFLWDLSTVIAAAMRESRFLQAGMAALFAGIIAAFLYGNLAFFLSRIGELMRHRHSSHALTLASISDKESPLLTVLVPSYEEDEQVVIRALLSASLAEYPDKRIVLLIDNAPDPKTRADAQALARMRELPKRLQGLLDHIGDAFDGELSAHLERVRSGRFNGATEGERLSGLYRRAAHWLEAQADGWVVRSHIDTFFVDRILREPAKCHRARADTLQDAEWLCETLVLREYRRLAGLFNAEFSSFERKQFENLSHEANKAMNLNSYLSLMGRSWRVSQKNGRAYLDAATQKQAHLSFPNSKYVLTLDADSIILNDYVLRLVNVMEAPGNERLAVAQTPYSAFPGTTNLLERVAGATTDIQYFIHQGFTQFNGTYWVGANALIRMEALESVAVRRIERGFPVTVYVQDRTVIEDTESSIDLIAKGWRLYNYPSRLAYSATPTDFGSLLIQRRRWANGGLIILPKLLRHIFSQRIKFAEGALRIHYLISLASISAAILLLLLIPFEPGLRSIWLPLAAAPYFLLYGRDLARAGYGWTDLFGVYALNLLLVPVHLGGVLKSLHQAFTGEKTTFVRTPKVASRTAAPPLYVWALLGLLVWSLISAIIGLLDGHWMRFAFSFINTIVLLFVVLRFIGVRECVEDAFAKCPNLRNGILQLLWGDIVLTGPAIKGHPEDQRTVNVIMAGAGPLREVAPQHDKC